MYTQCPHCNTLFRVHADQLKAAHGRVRCCRCRGAFDALENLGDAPSQYVAPEIPDTPPPPEPAAAPPSRQTTAEEPEAEQELPFRVPENLTDIAGVKADADDLPVDLAPPARHHFAWDLGILALIGLLILQLAWINRETLASYSQGRYLLEKVCSLAPCTVPLRKSPDQIRILNREVNVLPDERNAHQVRLIIANDAAFSQPFPLLQVELFTGDARLLAQRRFRPREYLPIDVPPDSMMAPGQTAELRLDLVDPGQSVTGYRFEFLQR